MIEAPPLEASESEFHAVHVSRIRVGSELKFPINDDHDVLLLSAGQVVTPAFMARLKQRGLQSIKVHESELSRICAGEPQGTAESIPPAREGVMCKLQNEGTEHLDEELARGNLGLPPQGEAFALQIQKHGSNGYDEDLRYEIIERRHQNCERIGDVIKTLAEGHGLDVEALTDVTDSALSDMTEDLDLFASIGINPFSGAYPARHSLHVCMLSLLIGTQLRLDRTTLKELAIGCLIHDSGMLKINKSLYTSRRQLTRVEFLEITKHPVIIFDLMKDMRAVTNRSAFIAYQVHERCNGSGYPRRLTDQRIHFLSKIAAVADSYIGIVSPRPHRPALSPYHAMTLTLAGVNGGYFDPMAVRALLATVSLFPIGSYVQLNNGQKAKVIRTNGDFYTKPVVQIWNDNGSETSIINLLESELTITKAVSGIGIVRH